MKTNDAWSSAMFTPTEAAYSEREMEHLVPKFLLVTIPYSSLQQQKYTVITICNLFHPCFCELSLSF